MMRPLKLLFLSLLLTGGICRSQDITGLRYPADPAQQANPDIPKGEVLKFEFNRSHIYPGTQRTYWVYIPAAYKPENAACLYVDMDGVQFGAPGVFDYLISKGEMPVTIGVFISAGTVTNKHKEVVRYNRSHEFDSMNNDFINFLLNELLPDVEKQKTTDGRAIVISKDANDHAIAGASSGAICAFTAAWQRPDVFSRIYSSIGTYVGMRGGDQYPEMVRKTEPKPVRIFLQDGYNDAWNPLFGNWYTANLAMEAALSFAGYEVNHSWGNGGHDGIQATAIFPDVMRWLWKGWPQKVQTGKTNNNKFEEILIDSEKWETIEALNRATAITAGPGGDVLVSDSLGWVRKIDPDNKISPGIKLEAEAIAETANGTVVFLGPGGSGLLAFAGNQKQASIAKNITGEKLLVTHEGDTYISAPAFNRSDGGKIWLVKPGGKAAVVDEGLRFASAICISADRNQLFVAEDNTNWIYSYVIQSNGSLANRQKWYWLHQADNYGYNRVWDLATDNEGNLYAATNLGMQVCDQNGRVRAILQLPYGPITGLCFGGRDFDSLFIICGGKVYKRKMKLKGVPSFAAPVYPKSIGAG